MSASPEHIQALVDKEAIRELVHAYCNAADRHDTEKMRSCYHEDAIDEHGAHFTGSAMDFIDALPEIQKSMRILHHNVTTHNIKLGDNGYAEGEVYILAFHQVEGADEPFDVLIGGRYFDKYEKRNDVWRFSHRSVVADWVNVHEPSFVNLEHAFTDGALIGMPGKKDPSYDFFTLFKFGER